MSVVSIGQCGFVTKQQEPREPAEEPAAKPDEAVSHAATTKNRISEIPDCANPMLLQVHISTLCSKLSRGFTQLVKADAHVDGITNDVSIHQRLEHARAKLESSRNNSAMRKVEHLLKMIMGKDEEDFARLILPALAALSMAFLSEVSAVWTDVNVNNQIARPR